MLQTTTELQNIGATNILTPKLRVTLKDNLTIKPVELNGASLVIGAPNLEIIGNLYFYYNHFGRDIKVKQRSGNSFIHIFGSSLGSGSAFVYENGDPGVFYRGVCNVVLYYVDGPISQNLRSISTSGGTVWGDSALIYSGSSRIVDLALAGPSALYIATQYEGVSSTQTQFGFKLHSLRNIAGTWGVTTLRHSPLFGNMDSFGHMMNAGNYDNEDILIVTASGNSNTANMGHGLKLMRTDGLNVFEERFLIDRSETFYSRVYMSNLKKGLSNYYMAIGYADTSYTNQSGVTLDQSRYFNGFLMESKNLIDWSNYLFFNRFIGTTNLISNYLSYGLATGLTQQPFIALQDSSGASLIDILDGNTTLDISNYVMSYNNQNNERITLELSNYTA